MRWIAWKTTTPIPNHWSRAAWKVPLVPMRQAAGAARLRTAEQVLRRKALMSWRQSPRSPLLRAAHPSLAHPEPVARHQELVFELAGAVVHHWTTGAVRHRMAPKDRQKTADFQGRAPRAEIYYSSTWSIPLLRCSCASRARSPLGPLTPQSRWRPGLTEQIYFIV